ncbi:MAG: ABC transporter ATP-binding protein [Candidatus Bathyarchaeota archaeon]|nr:MAG: ABC transporter ATP-binding protein [Candidatus Bathyarchaeota archaeon]
MAELVIKAENLRKWFPVSLGFLRSVFGKEQLFVRAVDDVSFHINQGEIFGLVGESGSGKTTTGRCLLKLVKATSGKIFFHGTEITGLDEDEMKKLRRRMQIIFQDPYESLNPRMSIKDIVAEPLRLLERSVEPREVDAKVSQMLEDVELTPPHEFTYRFPHELSGGQRQRVAVARAFVVNPEFIVADEPVSMLDVSIRAEILRLMFSLVERFNASFLYITHDLALSRHMCDRLAVMYLGKIMETGTSESVVFEPLHPYTKALIEAVPIPDPTAGRAETVIKGEIPSPVNPPSGCRFHTRCPSYIGDICRTKEPDIIDLGKNHYAACHLYGKEK